MSVKRAVLGVVGTGASVAAVAVRGAGALLSPWARLWRLVRLKACVDGTVPATTQFDGQVETAGRVRLELGERCRFGRRVFLETCERGVIRIGENVRINAGSFVVAYAEVSIGRDVLIGEYVSIRDADHGLAVGPPIREQPHAASPIRIGEGAWIGRGAVVLKGVQIGAGAVVAANSVVTKDVRAMAIVAGVPAREIRTRDGLPRSGAGAERPGATVVDAQGKAEPGKAR